LEKEGIGIIFFVGF